jgi:hypothetical protein
MWSSTELSSIQISPLHSLLFDVFRVVDTSFHNAINSPPPEIQSYSYIDFAFSFFSRFLAYVHRFAVSHNTNKVVSLNVNEDPKDGKNGTASVTISFTHTGYNTNKNEKMRSNVLQILHLWYAMALFRDGVVELVKAYEGAGIL